MAESLFDIFGDHHAKRSMKNVSKHPLSNIENMGKMATLGKIGSTGKSGFSGPIKPNEPMKKGAETKKSFLTNAGMAIQSTPSRQALTPRSVNVGQLIYSDDTNAEDRSCNIEDLRFTKPSYKYDNYHRDALDFLPMPELEIMIHLSPPRTPSPVICRPSMEFDLSYEDDLFTGDFSNESIPHNDLGLPELY